MYPLIIFKSKWRSRPNVESRWIIQISLLITKHPQNSIPFQRYFRINQSRSRGKSVLYVTIPAGKSGFLPFPFPCSSLTQAWLGSLQYRGPRHNNVGLFTAKLCNINIINAFGITHTYNEQQWRLYSRSGAYPGGKTPCPQTQDKILMPNFLQRFCHSWTNIIAITTLTVTSTCHPSTCMCKIKGVSAPSFPL